MNMELGLLCVTAWLLLVVIALFGLWYWKTSKIFKTFEKMDMHGPAPKFLIGNMGEMTSKGFHAVFKDWEKVYGKVYGVYRAKAPSIVIHDPEMLREIMVKNFAAFPNRQPNKVADQWPFKDMLTFLVDDHWRHVRNTLSPSFSSGRLKSMLPVIQRCCQNLVTRVGNNAQKGDEVDLKVLCNDFSMDVTAGTGFGIEVNCLLNPNEQFSVIANRILYPPQWIFTVLFLFPFMTNILNKIGITVAPVEPINYMMKIIKAALKERRLENQKHKDFLQSMVEAEQNEDYVSSSQIDPEIDHSSDLKTSESWKRKGGLTEDEILSNCLNFLLAGYENTATGMAFLLYNLAGNPHCLRKLQEEVDEVLGKNEEDYKAVTQMPYLDMCMNESLRLFPPGFVLDRIAVEDVDVKGVHIPKGMVITIPVYSVHTDPDYWPDPLKFDPERHTPEARVDRNPFCHMPFGHGPRNCIGMRMSQMEVKMGVAAIVKKFDPVLCEKSIFPPEISNHIRFGPKDKMWVKFTPRQQ